MPSGVIFTQKLQRNALYSLRVDLFDTCGDSYDSHSSSNNNILMESISFLHSKWMKCFFRYKLYNRYTKFLDWSNIYIVVNIYKKPQCGCYFFLQNVPIHKIKWVILIVSSLMAASPDCFVSHKYITITGGKNNLFLNFVYIETL